MRQAYALYSLALFFSSAPENLLHFLALLTFQFTAEKTVAFSNASFFRTFSLLLQFHELQWQYAN